jgi:hypothetical protein
MIVIPICPTFETFLVIINYQKRVIKAYSSVWSTFNSYFTLLNSIYLLFINWKDESIVIYFCTRGHIPMLLGVAAKNMALLSFNYWYSCSSIVAILMKDWSVEAVYRCLINFNDLIRSNCLIEQVSHYCQRRLIF